MKKVTILAAIALVLLIAAPQVQADIMIDSTLSDTTTDVLMYDTNPMMWAVDADGTFATGGYYDTTNAAPFCDLILGTWSESQDEAFVLTGAVDTLRITLTNYSTTDAADGKAGVSGRAGWYPVGSFTGSGTSGRNNVFGVSYTDRPVVPINSSVDWDTPLTAFDSGGDTFGSSGDGLIYIQIQSILSYSGVGGGDLRVTSVSLVPEPATMGLLAIGGLAMLRRKRRK